MGRKNNVPTQEEIDRLLKEKLDEYAQKHTAWVRLKYGNTYIGFDTYDMVTENPMNRLKILIELMDIKYSVKYPFGEDKKYYLIIDGEDKTIADFIQKFINNGYKLSW